MYDIEYDFASIALKMAHQVILRDNPNRTLVRVESKTAIYYKIEKESISL